MNSVVTAVYRNGVFVPTTACDIPENTEVRVIVQGSTIIPPVVTDPAERARIRREVLELMKQNPIPADALVSRASNSMNAVDTNVLIYANDQRDPRKYDIAFRLVDGLDDGALPLAGNLRIPCGVTKTGAVRVQLDQGMALLGNAAEHMGDSDSGLERAGAGIRTDPAIQHFLLGCIADQRMYYAGVGRLYSEDLDTHNGLDGLEIVNPFRERP